MTPARAAAAGRSRAEGWILAAGLAASAVCLWRTYCGLELVQWNAPRLAPAYALAHGMNIYNTQHAGPFLGWIYGPVFPLLLAPAAWLDSLPAFLAVAWLLNLAAFLVPAALCLRDFVPAARRPAAWTVLVGLWLACPPAQAQFHFLHVDALCLGFCLLSLRSLAVAAHDPGGRGTTAAAVWLALAIGTKQVAVAVPLAVAAWAWRRGHTERLRRFWFRLAVALGAGGALTLAAFGPDRVIFNCLWFHLHNPWNAQGFAATATDWLGALGSCWPALALAAAWRATGRTAPAPDRFADEFEHLLLTTALVALPFGLAAAAKQAGGLNSVHSLYLLLFALVLRWARTGADGSAGRRLGLTAALVAVLVAGGVWTAARAALPWRPDRSQQRDLAMARSSPGGVYFPWNPLATLITDHRAYPFDDALLCLVRAGLAPPPSVVQAEMPHHAAIIYPDKVQSRFALTYLEAPPEARPSP